MAHAKARNDIPYFYFPCPNCGVETFHAIVEELAGVTFGIPFMRPLLATQRANQVVCSECEIVNGRVDGEVVKKLESGLMPKAIYEVHPAVANFYTLATLKLIEERFADSPNELAAWKKAHGAYRLEL